MTVIVQCNACKGTYSQTLDDGTPYFHVCPPLSSCELAAAVAAGAVVLPEGETPDDAVTRRQYQRANQRNENRPSTAAEHADVMISEGAGITELPDAVPPGDPVTVPPFNAPPAPQPLGP